MVLADTMAIFLVVVGLLICFNALWLLCRALWGPLVAQSREIHRDGMVKSFFLGLPLTALIVVMFGAMTSNKQGTWGLIGLIVMAVYVMFTSIGTAGIADLIGEKLGGNTEGQPPWRETVRGGAILVLSFLFPILGQLVIMPIAIIVGCGATMRAMFREWKSAKHSQKNSRTINPPLSKNKTSDSAAEVLVADRSDATGDANDSPRDR
jgi:hypothetical protein